MEAEQERQEQVRGATDRALEAATGMLARWEDERDRSPLDRVVEAELRSRRYLNSFERRWVGDLVFNTVRFLRRQTWLLDALALPVTPEGLAWLGACAPGMPDGTPPLIPLTFRRTSPLVPWEALKAALARLPGPDDPRAFLRITLSYSDPMAKELEEQLGAEAVPAGVALNAQAPATLRVNVLRASREQVQAVLPEAKPTTYSPWGLELPAAPISTICPASEKVGTKRRRRRASWWRSWPIPGPVRRWWRWARAPEARRWRWRR